MQIDRWLELAEAEQDRTLHHFNFTRETGYSDTQLTGAHQEFRQFLASFPDDGPGAHLLLRSFVESQPSGGLDCRFLSPPMRVDDRLIFLRTVGSDDPLLDALRFDVTRLRQIEESIAVTVQSSILDEALEQQMQDALNDLIPDLVVTIPAGAAPRPKAGRIYAGAAPSDPSTTPWWFTYENAVLAEEASLPNRALPLERSGYVAGMRARLGLRHGTDTLSDHDMAKGPGMRFRILFQLALSVPVELRDDAHQPAIFSGGYPDLFVSHQRNVDGGWTVRLKDHSCPHSACQCAQDGLPEGVMKRSVVLDERCVPEIRGVYLAFGRDLARFGPPTCDEIRRSRLAA